MHYARLALVGEIHTLGGYVACKFNFQERTNWTVVVAAAAVKKTATHVYVNGDDDPHGMEDTDPVDGGLT